jgi:hypothetical protein
MQNAKRATPEKPTQFRARNKGCRDCVIQGTVYKIQGTPPQQQNFRDRRNVGGFELRENTPALEITAVPSNPDCPCQWDDRGNVEYIAIFLGLANQTRKQLFRMPPILQSRGFSIRNLPNYFTMNGCTLTIDISRINQDLRAGNIGGAPFNLKAVPTRLGLRVRCNGVWRKLLIVITD